LIALALATPAAAAIPAGFVPCAMTDGFYCGMVVVPLDYSNPSTGSTTLFVKYKPAKLLDTDGVLFALAGGPGQSATSFASEFAYQLKSALNTRDLVVFDQRGTGSSGYLDCPEANSIADCGIELGSPRDYYTSKTSAQDIDTIRETLEMSKASIYGVSYGTYVAQIYSRMFPTHTQSLALDSVVPATGEDPFMRPNYAWMQSALDTNCFAGLCKNVTHNVYADWNKLVKRAGSKKGLHVHYVGYQGETRVGRLSQSDLLYFMIDVYSSDMVSRSRVPAALHSAVQGDSYALGRLFASTGSASSFSASPVKAKTPTAFYDSDMSVAVYLSTICSEAPNPWAWNDPLSARAAEAKAAFAAIPSTAFAPFLPSVAYKESLIPTCINWPATTIDPAVAGTPANVPVLILNGEEDDLTPLSGAISVAALYPQRRLVTIPFSGHSVISNTWPPASGCVLKSIKDFYAGNTVNQCSDRKPFLAPAELPPTSLSKVRGIGPAGIRGKTVAAVLKTLNDLTTTILEGGNIVGLRGGTMEDFSEDGIIIKNMQYVPKVDVSGSYGLYSGRSKLKITGKGAHGKLVIRQHGKVTTVTGKLNGKRVHVRVATSPAALALDRLLYYGVASGGAKITNAQELVAALKTNRAALGLPLLAN